MKIFDEKGVTLYELLATFTITMIVLPVIYGVFSSGIKLYNKIQIEGQLRDDADYAATMIMNTFYSFPFDYVKGCGENCIELIDSQKTKIKKFEKGQSGFFYDINKEKQDNEKKIIITLTNQNNEEKTQITIDGTPLEGIADFKDSKISFTCYKEDFGNNGKCESGIIHLDFNLDDKRLEKPLHLKSEFGF
ncbi:hypothetical protein [Bacillus methanolicus]|uniref:Tfp pilus assembly protein n=1 Tax=Bacillus methanolicus (strain MGA3 / ATCC 53907) TaxID=796606 RepID=I3ECU1_BACMM|nr:hypothetical protein [Bacillus methanolicus]AIE60919.1 hypothetical protein BMMGA3_12630 [Bacillus methanolicus MGA3]EIJ84312.1 hypothetical protein MGA3_03475 [Bacillus methanolicus MGA3]